MHEKSGFIRSKYSAEQLQQVTREINKSYRKSLRSEGPRDQKSPRFLLYAKNLEDFKASSFSAKLRNIRDFRAPKNHFNGEPEWLSRARSK